MDFKFAYVFFVFRGLKFFPVLQGGGDELRDTTPQYCRACWERYLRHVGSLSPLQKYSILKKKHVMLLFDMTVAGVV